MNPKQLGFVFAALLPLAVAAKVTPEQAAKLGAELTPSGAEAAGNAEGSIPAWSGGLAAEPALSTAHRANPYADDKPLYVITAANMAAYQSSLTPGEIALLQKYPDSYSLPVYPSRRSFANPPAVYAATLQNAVKAELSEDGDSISGASLGVPFPITDSGREAIWNHRLRYHDVAVRRWNNQFAVSTTGEYNAVKLREDRLLLYALPQVPQPKPGNALAFLLQVAIEPARLAHSFTLIRDYLDGGRHPREAWQLSPGQEQWRRASNAAYDNFGVATDGLRTYDQADMFSGALDRYDWKLRGKRELIVPANAYALHSDQLKYTDLIHKNHLNQSFARYELRRVWILEARAKKGSVSNRFARRSLFLDEDSWQIVLADLYNEQDELTHVQEAHSIVAAGPLWQTPVLQTTYDLGSGRYLAEGLDNEDPEPQALTPDPDDFTPSRAARQARR